MEQVLIATDLYVHNQTNHIVFVNIVWLVECGRAESGNSGRARSATAKKGFTLGYSLQYRQAVWVAYTLTAENLQAKQVRRRDQFRADPEVKNHPVHPKDYTRSGFDKGHLAPVADAKYSRKVKVNNLIFTLPGELCETMSACYKADLNGDKVPDYVFASIKVWNGRFAGQSDVDIFVSNPQKKYTFSAFETRHLEAEVINGKVMLVKYVYSDNDENLIRQVYTFNKDGRIQLYQADALLFFKK